VSEAPPTPAPLEPLRPCPFCTAVPTRVDDKRAKIDHAADCYMRRYVGSGQLWMLADAERWNRRSPSSPAPAEGAVDEALRDIDLVHQVLGDWLRTFADTEFEADEVDAAQKRIALWGTVGYIAHASGALRRIGAALSRLSTPEREHSQDVCECGHSRDVHDGWSERRQEYGDCRKCASGTCDEFVAARPPAGERCALCGNVGLTCVCTGGPHAPPPPADERVIETLSHLKRDQVGVQHRSGCSAIMGMDRDCHCGAVDAREALDAFAAILQLLAGEKT
jgi:hypothetical protein